MSGDVVLMTLVGGLGTMLGPFVGAFVIVAVQHLASFGECVTLIQGLIFVVCVLSCPRRVVGECAAPLKLELWLCVPKTLNPTIVVMKSTQDGT